MELPPLTKFVTRLKKNIACIKEMIFTQLLYSLSAMTLIVAAILGFTLFGVMIMRKDYYDQVVNVQEVEGMNFLAGHYYVSTFLALAFSIISIVVSIIQFYVYNISSPMLTKLTFLLHLILSLMIVLTFAYFTECTMTILHAHGNFHTIDGDNETFYTSIIFALMMISLMVTSSSTVLVGTAALLV